MPTITLQVGQCGNQVGAVLWDRLAAQSASDKDTAVDRELFRYTPNGRRWARSVLVDTEPKVVNAVLSADKEGLFNRQMCYVGQSGRGNNWAFGYNQISLDTERERRTSRTGGCTPAWVSSTATEDPSRAEYLILEQVLEGIRREAEECDSCPSFMLIHSLAGGSGSGMGSRLLEHLRAAYPLAFVAAASVVPRVAGDTPMQSLNSVMALSFVQAYADVGVLLNNQDLMDASARLGAGAAAGAAAAAGAGAGAGASRAAAGMGDVNRLAAQALAGFLWPLGASDALGGGGRIRDAVTSVAADPCTKLVETWTAHSHPNVAAGAQWSDSLAALSSVLPRADALRGGAPATTAAALLLARGYPPASVSAAAPGPALAAYTKSLGHHGAAPTLQPDASLFLRTGAAPIVQEPRRGAAAAGAAGGAAGGKPPVAAAAPSVTLVANRSGVIGLLEGTVRRALALCDAGAYLHWYERHGCSAEAVQHAAHGLLDVASCYRQQHRNLGDP